MPAKETQSVIVKMSRPMHRRVKLHAKKDYGNNMSQLIRAAVSEFLLKHYGEDVSPNVDWGGPREEAEESEAVAVLAG